MASVIQRLRNRRTDVERGTLHQFQHLGQPYPFDLHPATSMPGSRAEVSGDGFEQLVSTVGSRSAIVSGAIQARSLGLSQIQFRFRSKRDRSRMFGSPALLPLEEPAPNMTRWGLLSRVEPDVAFHGNMFWRRLPDGRIKRLRPDWTWLLIGSNERGDPDEAAHAADAELIGYVYQPGGPNSQHRPQSFLPSEIVHWAPMPHPLRNFLGEAWMSKVWREVAADLQSTDHVTKFFDNAATANMVVKPPEIVNTKDRFDEWVDAFTTEHTGVKNAWRTVFAQAGTDVQVVGSKLAELAMEELQGGFETRVSSASRVPATVALYREGNKGSALNAGNYGQIRRMWSDLWFQSYAQGFCDTVAGLINVPSDAELTFDPDRVLLLQEDQQDAANIRATDAATIRQLTDGGFEADAAVEYVRQNGDLRELIGGHTGLPSVQVQPGTPNTQETDDD